MSGAEPALPVEVERTADAPLSARYRSDPEHRANPERRPRWTPVANPGGRGMTCQECAQLQHETGGRFGPRMQPRKRRSLPARSATDPATGYTIRVKGPTLLLCSRHAYAWTALDEADMA